MTSPSWPRMGTGRGGRRERWAGAHRCSRRSTAGRGAGDVADLGSPVRPRRRRPHGRPASPVRRRGRGAARRDAPAHARRRDPGRGGPIALATDVTRSVISRRCRRPTFPDAASPRRPREGRSRTGWRRAPAGGGRPAPASGCRTCRSRAWPGPRWRSIPRRQCGSCRTLSVSAASLRPWTMSSAPVLIGVGQRWAATGHRRRCRTPARRVGHEFAAGGAPGRAPSTPARSCWPASPTISTACPCTPWLLRSPSGGSRRASSAPRVPADALAAAVRARARRGVPVGADAGLRGSAAVREPPRASAGATHRAGRARVAWRTSFPTASVTSTISARPSNGSARSSSPAPALTLLIAGIIGPRYVTHRRVVAVRP